MTRVVHCKREKYDVLIDRRTKWGNPFKIGKEGTREEVILKYIDYFFSRPNLINSIHTLYDKTLACWCAPHDCHGNFLGLMADFSFWGEMTNGRAVAKASFHRSYDPKKKYNLDKIFREARESK